MAPKQTNARISTIWGRLVVVSALIVSALYLSASPLVQYPFPGPRRAPAGGGGGGAASFSDNFDRANSDSLGGNWTEAAGDCDIASNVLSLQTASFAEHACVYTGTALTSASEYVKVQVGSGSTWYPTILLRYTNSSSAFYFLQLEISSEVWEWHHMTQVGGTDTTVQAASALSSGINTYGVTIIGTGTATTVRIWKNPTGNAPDSGGTTWGGAGPTWTLTNDPASPVNTGSYVGLGGFQSGAGNITLDNFYGGDVP